VLVNERHDVILKKLEKYGVVYVSELSRLFSVSEETIRRDLERLEEEGFARRCYGGASFQGGKDVPIVVRRKTNVTGKRRIADELVEMIPDGAVIALDDSTTANFVAEALKEKSELTVITYSLEIALLLADKKEWNIILTGGKLNSKHHSLLGPRVYESICNYSIDWTIISCAGMDVKRGFFDAEEDNAKNKQAMIDAAEHVILAADEQKFGRKSLTLVAPFEAVETIVTDFEPDEKWKAAFEKKNVKLVCAL